MCWSSKGLSINRASIRELLKASKALERARERKKDDKMQGQALKPLHDDIDDQI